jgi:acyl-lipid omega-6 desaturase (Delta-12 desaturase)
MNDVIEKRNWEALKSAWPKMLEPYQHPQLRRSLGQLANTLLPYLALWVLMIFSLRISYWLTLVLMLPAAGFLMRLFIIFHDCGHGSFFESKKANSWVGFWLGVLSFTPSDNWWHDHEIHHYTSGDLDRRGVGDVPTLTVEEYRQSSAWKRLVYRCIRHPLGLLLVGPVIVFFFTHRFPTPKSGRRERLSVIYQDIALLAIFVGMSLAIGWKSFLLIQLPLMYLSGVIGIWLFYVQHQFENAYWVRHEQWDYTHAALAGASYYHLPRWLQWFSGNIGFHHIHHLNPRIPNYLLEKVYREVPLLQPVTTLSLRASLKSLSLGLWHEQAQKMVGFKGLQFSRD